VHRAEHRTAQWQCEDNTQGSASAAQVQRKGSARAGQSQCKGSARVVQGQCMGSARATCKVDVQSTAKKIAKLRSFYCGCYPLKFFVTLLCFSATNNFKIQRT
jgi:hypothetical protein